MVIAPNVIQAANRSDQSAKKSLWYGSFGSNGSKLPTLERKVLNVRNESRQWKVPAKDANGRCQWKVPAKDAKFSPTF